MLFYCHLKWYTTSRYSSLPPKLVCFSFQKSAMRVTVLSHSPHLLFFTREKELAAVKINPADVEIIASELEVFIHPKP
jgi:hypothetical protein